MALRVLARFILAGALHWMPGEMCVCVSIALRRVESFSPAQSAGSNFALTIAVKVETDSLQLGGAASVSRVDKPHKTRSCSYDALGEPLGAAPRGTALGNSISTRLEVEGLTDTSLRILGRCPHCEGTGCGVDGVRA